MLSTGVYRPLTGNRVSVSLTPNTFIVFNFFVFTVPISRGLRFNLLIRWREGAAGMFHLGRPEGSWWAIDTAWFDTAAVLQMPEFFKRDFSWPAFIPRALSWHHSICFIQEGAVKGCQVGGA